MDEEHAIYAGMFANAGVEQGKSKVPDYITKRINVTFKTGLPMGTRADFKYEGQPWIAYPREKTRRIHAALDRLIGLHAGITKEMVKLINARPQDADLIAQVLERTASARKIQQELIREKTEARTM